MSGTTTKAGTPLSSLPTASAVADTDLVLLVIDDPITGLPTPVLVQRATVAASPAALAALVATVAAQSGTIAAQAASIAALQAVVARLEAGTGQTTSNLLTVGGAAVTVNSQTLTA
ncbi:hypothetical protein HN018_06975 [Lichenicola cladoniae]|uniref:Uncharacterized protein n=1 Tax=Lichenicola cladoniae TaxID=1484109 RepID=A0A6M8HNF5_9PROT|nr:hypothetical protein [Lichenicola cladoniae]NPD67316.1 hypothetical protein [Acetobacteraceae bacterium]QKE89817.1 hypothetical protein HN018_06975 [Lichenicola cladoniae]